VKIISSFENLIEFMRTALRKFNPKVVDYYFECCMMEQKCKGKISGGKAHYSFPANFRREPKHRMNRCVSLFLEL
jgi:hypothetical protein